VLLAAFVLHPSTSIRTREGRIVLLLLLAAFLLSRLLQHPLNLPPRMLVVPVFLIGVGLAIAPHRRMVIGTCLVYICCELLIGASPLLQTRNFFGVIKVFEGKSLVDGQQLDTRLMRHGTTLHGLQFLGKLRTEPTTYYSRKGPLGDIFKAYNPDDIAVIGLGVGTTACYNAPRRSFTFIDIDPEVLHVAQTYFTYLKDCPSRQAAVLRTGDGRLELQKSKDKYDLIVLDAFSSDFIPTHLMTVEAMKTYFEHIKTNGFLIMHLSNRHFRLESAAAATAAAAGLETSFMRRDKNELEPYGAPSAWLVVARPGFNIEKLEQFGWKAPEPDAGTRPWTDDYTNLLSALEAFHAKKN
jgi:hypothetical protein